MERDVSEFVILKYSRLMLICRCDIWLDNSQKLFSNVEVQFVINCFNNLVFGPCRVYIEDGPRIQKRLITLKWIDPKTKEKITWEVTNLTLVYGLQVLNHKSRYGVCPYCPQMKTFSTKSSGYIFHVIHHHGELRSGELVPDPACARPSDG